jgi:DNA-binding beta-propeller fold protein YncE
MRPIRMLLVVGVVVALGVAGVAGAAGFPPFLTSWGANGSAPGFFNSPDMVAVDARGVVYVADRNNNRVEEFDRRGHLISVLGRVGRAPGRFRQPRGVTPDGHGALYVADTGNNRIQKFDARGRVVAVWGRHGGDGSAGVAPGEFDNPRGLATDSAGDLYVADHGNNRIQKLSPNGTVLAKWGRHGGDGSPGSGAGEFRAPRGVAVDRFGDVFVADKENNRIQKFDSRGRFLLMWGRDGGDGTPGRGNGEFHLPYSVAASPSGQIYVADTGNNRLQEFTFAGRFLRRMGHNGGDGTAGSAPGEFSTPYGVGVDCRGNLYVTDEGNDRVQVFGKAGSPARCVRQRHIELDPRPVRSRLRLPLRS